VLGWVDESEVPNDITASLPYAESNFLLPSWSFLSLLTSLELWYIEPRLCMKLSSEFASRRLEGRLLQWKFGIRSRYISPDFASEHCN
jgi:hypothetical protein